MTKKRVLIQALESMSARDQRHVMQCMQHYEKEWRRIARAADAPSVAHSVHCVLDERMQHLLATSPHAKDVKCGRGCASCCHLNVDITAQEAELLALCVREAEGVSIDMQRLHRQADTPWDELPPADQRCVFLGADNACTVYEHRPGSCRKYFVVTDPQFCDTAQHPGHEVGILFDMEGELIHAAALKTHGAGSLASMLRDALKKEEERP